MNNKPKLPNNMNNSELFKLFGKYAKYVQAGQFYYIMFNGKDLSADNPSDLFQKVKKEYEIYQNLNNYYKNGLG